VSINKINKINTNQNIELHKNEKENEKENKLTNHEKVLTLKTIW